jgi:tRNA1Val (adenine37-N6)-methyltransferase
MEFRKHPVNELVKNEGIIEISPNVRSDWYQELTRDFYIR